mgnify:CR=1 FL=1
MNAQPRTMILVDAIHLNEVASAGLHGAGQGLKHAQSCTSIRVHKRQFSIKRIGVRRHKEDFARSFAIAYRNQRKRTFIQTIIPRHIDIPTWLFHDRLHCVGCGEPLAAEVLDLGDGARVHWERHREFACLIAYGTERKGQAVARLAALGLQPPIGWGT